MKKFAGFLFLVCLISLNVDTMPALAVQKDGQSIGEQNGYKIKHAVYRNQLMIECLLPDLDFRKQANAGINVYIDDVLAGTFKKAAFVLKDLAPGNYSVRVEVIGAHSQPVARSRFSITVIE